MSSIAAFGATGPRALARDADTIRVRFLIEPDALAKTGRRIPKMHAVAYALSGPDGFVGLPFSAHYRALFEEPAAPVLARARASFDHRRPGAVDLPLPEGTTLIGVITPYRTLEGKTWLAVGEFKRRWSQVDVAITKVGVRFA
ncbi:MAG: hypothetical protein AAFR11_15525 [Pseudomonadota bacterium]